MEGVLAIMFIFGGGTLSCSRSARWAGPSPSASGRKARCPSTIPSSSHEVDALRRDVTELQERVTSPSGSWPAPRIGTRSAGGD